jgi:2-polyprenyl-3-methyl-5-hydroxy-6-metoxy-1,4-benzoquinol methylase
MPCPVCHSDKSRVICDCSQVPPRLTTLTGIIHECSDCRFIYKETIEQPLDRLADLYRFSLQETRWYFGPTLKGYRENSPEIRFFSSVLQETQRHLSGPVHTRPPRLLDVGCATGAFLDRSRAFGFDPYGVELNPYLAQYAQDAFNLPVIVGELTLGFFEPDYFDAISMLDVIEHVPDPVAILNAAGALLRPGGLIVLYTPNHRSVIARLSLATYQWSGGRVRGPVHIVFGTNHVSFFDHHSLPAVLRRAGFECEALYRIPYDTQYQGEIRDTNGFLKFGVQVVESVARIINLPYRLLAFARKPT